MLVRQEEAVLRCVNIGPWFPRLIAVTLTVAAAIGGVRAETPPGDPVPAGYRGLPFRTQDAEPIEPGTLILDIGAAYRDAAKDFGMPDRESQWNLAATRVTIGLGRIVEAQLDGAIVIVPEVDGNTHTDSGDWTLGTKVRFLAPGKRRPAMSLLWEVKLPNASNEKGGGTDEVDFFGHILIGRRFAERRNALHASLGIGLLGDPAANGAQDDVFIGKLAWQHDGGLGKTVWGVEVEGRDGFKTNDSPFYARAVYGRRIGQRWWIHGAFGAGLNDESDDYNVDVRLRRSFRVGDGE